MGIPFTVVFLCENVQLALTVSPRIATGTDLCCLALLYAACCTALMIGNINLNYDSLNDTVCSNVDCRLMKK